MRQRRQARRRSSSSRWTSPSTTGASSPAARASSRAAPPASTWRTTPRSCAATRSASSRRSRRGTTRSTWRPGRSGPRSPPGNTVVLKPSELTPLTALRLAEITADILPPGVLNVVTGQGETAGAALVRHPDVAMVSLTGDVATGKIIARAAADTLKRVHLELGGKAPVIVFDDADIEAVVATLTEAGVLQLGPGLHRAVPRDRRAAGVRRPFVAGSPTRSARIMTGDPLDDDDRDGPGGLGRPARAGRRHRRPCRRGRRRGHRRRQARSTAPASSTSRRSSSTPRQDSEIVQREVFGPVVTVQRFSDEDAGARAGPTTSTTGSSASVWTQRRRPRDADDARRCTSARVWVNDHIPIVSEMPARRLQAVGLRQGHVDLRDRGATPSSST